MAIYIITFSVSSFLLIASDRVKRNQREILRIIAIVIPCVLAALRDERIGTDYLGYLKPMVTLAKNSTSLVSFLNSKWFSVWHYRYIHDFEPAFVLLVWGLIKLTGSYFVLLFTIELLVIVPFYLGIKESKDINKVWIGMLAFYLFYYNSSYNIMRQSIAISFFFYALVKYLNKDIKGYIIWQFVAITFHYSSVLGLLIVLMNIVIHKSSEYGRNTFLVIICGLIFLVGTKFFAQILSLFGLGSYVAYFSGNIRFMPNQFISRAPIVIMFFLNWKILKENKNNYLFLAMMFYSVIFAQFTSVNQFASRISTYFMLSFVFAFDELSRCKFKKININKGLVISYSILYWLYYYSYSGVGETVPYIFR